MTEEATSRSADRAGNHAPAEAAWLAAAAEAARKSGRLGKHAPDSEVWSRLTRHAMSGITVPPLGTPASVAALPTQAAMAAAPGVAPFLRGSRPSGAWDVRALIGHADPAEAHRSVMAALNGGATSLWLQIGPHAVAPADLAQVLADVHVEAVPIVLDVSGPADLRAAADVLSRLAADAGTALHPASCLGLDPVGALARRALGPDTATSAASEPRPADGESLLGHLAAVADDAARWGVRAVTVDAGVVHDAGADAAVELGYAAATGAAYLRSLTGSGLDVDTACRLIEFRLAVTDEQFPSIAKLRAARLIWHRVCELSGASPAARAARVHAVTSRAMPTRYDRYVNMLRGTVATFAAGVGGADAVTTLPFDIALGDPDEFAERMARNVSALLLGEAHVAAVADAAGGSYAVEMLTSELAEASWAAFGEIDAAGGVQAVLIDGTLAARLAELRAERDRRIARRARPITGVSEFPDPAETAPAHADRPTTAWPRWAEPFEALRDSPPDTPALILRVGPPARASARVLFAENLLTAGGVRLKHAAAETNASGPLADAVADSGCHTVVLAGADADYAADLAGLLRAVRDGGARTVFLAGRPVPVLSALPDGLIDGTVAAGDDALEFLRTVRATLGASS